MQAEERIPDQMKYSYITIQQSTRFSPWIPWDDRANLPAHPLLKYKLTYYKNQQICAARILRNIFTDFVVVGKELHYWQILDLLTLPPDAGHQTSSVDFHTPNNSYSHPQRVLPLPIWNQGSDSAIARVQCRWANNWKIRLIMRSCGFREGVFEPETRLALSREYYSKCVLNSLSWWINGMTSTLTRRWLIAGDQQEVRHAKMENTDLTECASETCVAYFEDNFCKL